jgi:phosphoesterase RecJ-like protein
LRSLRGIEVACILKDKDGEVRGSLRAKGDLDISGIARKFGGGGHKAAAGFTLVGSLYDALGQVKQEIIDVIDTSF